MSVDVKKPSRFGMLKGVRDAPPANPEAAVQPAGLARDDSTQEPFSCTLSRGMKRKLKKACADEGRRQYLLVEQALEEYLARHHPTLE
jgi:hypothetical protein